VPPARPEPHAPGEVPTVSPACAELIAQTAATLRPKLDDICHGLVDRVIAEMHLPTDDEDLREDLFAATRGSAHVITDMAQIWADPHAAPAPEQALAWARGLVEAGLSIEQLLRVFRIGQASSHDIWQQAFAASDAPAAVVLEAVAAMSAFTFALIDTISAPLVAAYEEERLRRLRGADAVRTETIAALLAGEPVDEQSAGARLGYRIERQHVAFIAWLAPDEATRGLDDLHDVLDAAWAATAGLEGRPLLSRAAPRSVYGWCATAATARAQDALAATATAGDIRVAIGEPGRGAAGFRESHEQARRARRVAQLLHRDAAITTYTDVAVLDLLTQDVDAARNLARRALGPLGDGTTASGRLLRTLQAYVDEGRSFARAAPHLGVHENTVAYRVRRALDITRPANEQTFWTAVALAPLLGAR